MPNAAHPAARSVVANDTVSHTVSRIVSDETLSRIIQIESAGRTDARARTSSATGLAQFVSATWLATVRKHRPDWFKDRTTAQVLALRLDARSAIEMLARFSEDNTAIIGAGWSDGDLYLAHFAGPVTARNLCRAHPSTPASSVFSAAAVAANPSILSGRTCAEVRAWAARKMAAAGDRNWITVYMRGAKPVTPPAVKRIAKGTAAGAATTAVVGAQQHWSVSRWLIAAGLLLLIAGIAGVIWWWRSRHAPNKIEQCEVNDGLV